MPLDNFNGSNDFFEIIRLYLQQQKSKYKELKTKQKIYTIESLHASNSERLLTGLIHTGDYGFESDLIDVATHDTKHHRESSEAEVLPFYFLIAIPKGAKEGLMLLQTFQHFGIKTLIYNIFVKRFNTSFTNHRIDIEPLVPMSLIKKIIQRSRISEARFVRNNVPTDLADVYSESAASHEECVAELTLRAKKKFSVRIKDRVTDFLHGRRKLNELVKIRSFEYDTIKIECEIGEKKRTINLGNFGSMRPNFDITGTVKVGKNGHPTYSSIDEQAKALMLELGIP